jgi:hypothetical protein
MDLAIPSHNPDPRIRLAIRGEHNILCDIIVNGQRVFKKRIKQKTLDAL